MPAPKHITELLTKILSESPDRPLRGAYDCEAEADDKLIAVGLDPVAVKKLMWSDEDSVTFAVDAKYHVVMWVANSADQRAFSHADMDDLFTGIQRETKIDKGVVGMDWKKYKVLASWHRDFFNSGDRTDKNMLLGRLWKNNRFVSFWSKKADTTKEWKLITNFIREMGLDPEKCVYEFIDKLDVELYDEVVGKETASVEPSAEELAALHVKTDGDIAKKKALGDIGKYRAVQHQKDRIGDGVIKRGNLLKENPDTVYFPTTSEFDQKLQNHGIKKPRRVLKWSDGEAVTFSYDKSSDILVFCVPDYAMRHVDVYKTMRTYLYNKDAFTFSTDSDSLWTLIPKYPDSETQPVTFIGIRGESEIADYILKIQGEQGPTNGGRQHYITGRVWPKDQVISYWAKRNDALESTAFNAVLKMMASIKVDPSKTLYEFGDDEDAIYFYDELGIEKASTMTKERYAELISRQHIDPEAKKELRKYNLAHGMEEPNKFGNESPAAVKFRQNQSDGTIKRGNLLKEDPDKIHTANGRWEFTDDDAQTFIYRSQDGLLFRARTGTWKSPSKMFHSDMVMLFASIGSVFNHDSIDTDDGDSIKITTVDQFNTYSEIMDLGIVWDDSAGLITNRQKATIQCFGDTSKTIKFFKSLSQDPEELDDPRIRMKYSSIGIMGRYWEDTEVSSFWLNKRDLGRLISKGALDTYFDYMGISKENARLNAIDKSCGIFDVKSALEAAGKKATMSKADTTDALSRPHLGKGNKNMAGDKSVEDIEAEKKKRSDNYSMWLTTPHIRKKDAAYNDLLPALEEHKLMTESPDTVIDSDGHTS